MIRAAVVGVVAGLAGCTSVPPGNPMLMAQYRQVRMIPDPDARLRSMEQVALSAAYAGDAGTIVAVLKDLEGQPSHDLLAKRCSAYLSTAKKPTEARMVAKRIGDPALRAEALAPLDAKPADKTDAPAAGG
jgi:hypothetical protein